VENPIFKTPREIVIKGKKEVKKYQLEAVKQILQLSTAGFGLVAALAWNEFIKTTIDTYIKPRLGAGSHILSLAIYAIIVTLLAVFITVQLGRLEAKIEESQKKV
jgi:hypothetical protein